MSPCRRRHWSSLVSSTMLVVVAALLVLLPESGCDGAAASVRRRGGSFRRGGGGTTTVRAVPCPGSTCRCRLNKFGDPVARCRTPPNASSRLRAGASEVVFAELVLRRVNLTRLAPGAFGALRATSLDLSGNLLGAPDSVDGSAFDGGLNETLEVLSLGECRLVDIPSAAVSSLRVLRVLRLDDNAITAVPAAVLDACGHSLRELYLYRNAIGDVDPAAFRGLAGLQILSLAENRIESLPADVFAPLVKLTSLDLARNRLHELRDGWIDGLRSLRWLELESNRLSAIGPSTFRGVPALRNVRAENNELRSIADGTFRPIAHLSYLSIDLSNVTTLTPRTLAGIRRLRTLSLGEIRHSTLPDGFFATARSLKYLSMTDYGGLLQSVDDGVVGGLRPELFAADFRFRQLNVWLTPIRGCRCSEAWIRAFNGRGAYVHGYCQDTRPLSCPAGGKATGGSKASSGAFGKTDNGRLRRVKSGAFLW